MNCPKCNRTTVVVDTRKVGGARQRRRRCKNGHDFFTSEMVVAKWDYIDPRVKQPGVGKGQVKKRDKKPRRRKFILAKAPDWVKAIYKKINE